MDDHSRCAAAVWRASVRCELLEALVTQLGQELERVKQENAPKGPRAVEQPEEPA